MHFQSIKEKVLFGIFKHIPIKKNIVIFKSFGGQYGDNPKYISEKFHELRPEYKLYWVISNKSSGIDFPNYVFKVKANSLRFIFYSSVAKYVVDNMSGIRGVRAHQFRNMWEYFIGRPGQLDIATWHGTPLKRIGCDVTKDNISYYQTSANCLLAGNEYSRRIFTHAFNGINIKLLGTPRNDILLKRNVNKKELRLKLGLPSNKKIMLYAPTFRENIRNSGISQLESIDIKALLDGLSLKFGSEWILVLRLHHEVLRVLRTTENSIINGENIFNGNDHDDMSEYLACADALLTDYSSSLFDFMLTNKPCFLFAEDRENYISDERGTYFPIGLLPFNFADNAHELLQNIYKYDQKSQIEKNTTFLKKIGNIEDGNSAERIVNYMLEN